MLGSRPASLVHIGTGVIVSCGFFWEATLGFFIRTDTGTELSVEYRPANREKMFIDSA